MKILLPFLTVSVICASLLNSGYFGNVSLTAYFGFCIASVIVSLLLYFQLFKSPGRIQPGESFRNPGPLSFFLLLTAYILLHGFLYPGFNLSHYYWLAAASLLLALTWITSHDYFQIRSARKKEPIFTTFLTNLHRGIILVAVIESIIVIFQWLGLLPSMNSLFAGTGTWANPNVTAMFLALSLFSQKQAKTRNGKILFFIQLSAILSAIVLLQCRTAYIVAAILLLELYKNFIPGRKLTIIKFSAIVLFVFFLGFAFKTNSTDGRIQIWKNCLQLIYTNPVTGAGFGQFEKEYNAFVAAHNLPSTDHVFMPYNDFLELAVEGGIIAVVLWIGFLAILIRRFKNHSHALALVISFIVIQLTNFGFQAIPVFALFLIYAGSHLQSEIKIKHTDKKPVGRFPFKPVAAIAIIAEILLITKILLIANAFHQTTLILAEYPPQQAIEEHEKAGATLDFSSSYHENSGDLLMQVANYRDAKSQYRCALQTTSRPDVMGKCGWCYGQLGQYDSAVYYFKAIEKLQPFKYAPRMALLKIYEQQKDTASIKLKAREIIAMPVKVPGAEVDKMKEEARKWLQSKL